jgi:DNA-binding MarR family transcriptional regulator
MADKPTKLNKLEMDKLVFRVNRLVQAIDTRFGLDELDLAARALLNVIAEADSERRFLRPSDIVRLPNFGTPPTVYSHLAKLERAGWIQYKQDQNDRRARLVLLTPAARDAFKTISQEMHVGLNGGR